MSEHNYKYKSISYNDEDTVIIKTKLNGDIVNIVVKKEFIDKFPEIINKAIEMDKKKPFDPENPNFYMMQYFGGILEYLHNIKGPAIYHEDPSKRQVIDYFINGYIYKPGEGETEEDVVKQWKTDGFGSHFREEFEKWLDKTDEE